MSSINYIRLCQSQQKEISTSRSQYLEENEQFFPRKKKDPDLVAAELRSNRRDYRSNMCSNCFTAKASNGSCNC